MSRKVSAVPASLRKGKLVFVVNVDWFFISHRLPLAIAARDEGWEVHVFTTDTGRVMELEDEGFLVKKIPLGRALQNPLLEVYCLLSVITGLLRVKPDVVHCVAFKAAIFGGLAARLTRVPGIIVAVTGLGSTFLQSSWKSRLWKRLVFQLMRFICHGKNTRVILQNSDDVGEFVASGVATRDQIALVRGSGVSVPAFPFVPEPDESGGFCCILPARLLKDKGVYEFVEAARIIRVRGAGANLRMVLVGAIDPHNSSSVTQAEIESWVKEGNAIEATGQVNDMASVYQGCHVVVLPSYREGLPKVLIEAGSSGRASITTDVPGCREIVKDGVNGLIVPSKNAAALADAIQKLMRDRSLRHALGRRAHQIVVDEYDVRHIVQQTLRLYDQVVSERCASL